MPTTKADLFEQKDVTISRIARALSHPARVAILRELAQRNRCICGEIVDLIPLAQSTVSQHLSELKAAGFITGEIEGPRSCYCIHWKNTRKSLAIVAAFLNDLDSCTSCK